MTRIRDVRVGVRLGVAFGVLTLLIVAVAAVGVWSASNLRDAQDRIVQALSDRQSQLWACTVELDELRRDKGLGGDIDQGDVARADHQPDQRICDPPDPVADHHRAAGKRDKQRSQGHHEPRRTAHHPR